MANENVRQKPRGDAHNTTRGKTLPHEPPNQSNTLRIKVDDGPPFFFKVFQEKGVGHVNMWGPGWRRLKPEEVPRVRPLLVGLVNADSNDIQEDVKAMAKRMIKLIPATPEEPTVKISRWKARTPHGADS